VCFDKTGTLTDGTIAFDRLVVLADYPVEAALGAIADDVDRNATVAAIGGAFPPVTDWDRVQAVPFSSARKWSGASFADKGTWVLGAPEIVLPDGSATYRDQAAALAGAGQRVLTLARTDAPLAGQQLPAGLQPAAFVVFRERLRADAADAIAFFARQGVSLKVISGDSPHTVGAVAAQAGIPGWETPVDARELPDEPVALSQVMEDHSVFGRVAPHQKQAMVTAMQARGHTVAMTGDGVNDVLALKLADIGIAMGTGTVATKAVAELVLLDARFATLPGVVAEGRRVTANIERVANLFITKSVWATLLAVGVAAALLPYPFLPRQLTVVDTVTIGVPSFFLALAPNRRRYIPGFVRRVLRFAIPSGTVVAAATLAAYLLARASGLSPPEQRTSAVAVAVILGLTILTLLAVPLTWRRVALIGVLIAAFAMLFPVSAVRSFFALEQPSHDLWAMVLISAAGASLLIGIWVVVGRRSTNPQPPGGR
jgi:cation-transporting ATPase E